MNLLAQIGSLVSGDGDPEMRLVAAAQRGSREAYDSLMRAHERQLKGFLSCRVGTGAADDVLQETWVAAWQALPRFSRRGRFRAWLYGIAHHKSIDYHRNQRRQPAEIPLEETMPAPEMHDWSGSAELQETVMQMVAELPPEQREVLDLYYYGELTLAEVAMDLGRNLNTVKSQFYRAHAAIALRFERSPHAHLGVALVARDRVRER